MKYTNLRWWLPKFLCLMAAFAFWIYVMNEQNPLVENSYTVPVEVRNLDRSLVALNVPQRVKVKIRMNRSDLVSMRSDNIKAYVDLDGFTDGDYPNTPIHISVPGNETVISQDQTYFDLFIDTYAVKSLPAQVDLSERFRQVSRRSGNPRRRNILLSREPAAARLLPTVPLSLSMWRGKQKISTSLMR